MATAEFEQAALDVKNLGSDPGTKVKLRLYGLFKQATEGDVTGSRPGFTNPVGRQKYDAWAALAGTPREAAQEQYVAVVRDLTAH